MIFFNTRNHVKKFELNPYLLSKGFVEDSKIPYRRTYIKDDICIIADSLSDEFIVRDRDDDKSVFIKLCFIPSSKTLIDILFFKLEQFIKRKKHF